MTNEEFYDSEIAPKLMEMARACEARGMSFVACVEYAPEETGETAVLAAGSGIKARMAYWGVKARGNVDSFMIAAQRHAREHGHSSLFLSQAGVPTSPARTGADTP